MTRREQAIEGRGLDAMPKGEIMIHNHLPAYEASYELDGLDVLGLHVTGHGHDLDTLELVLTDAWHDELIDAGSWEITERWLRKVPHPDGGMAHVYANQPGRGARAVTVLARPQGWNYWCYRHRWEPATIGCPVSRFVDGERLAADAIAAEQAEDEPRTIASADDHDRAYRARIYLAAVAELEAAT